MSKNKLTPQEKQMPTIRLPLRIIAFCCIDLFIAFIGCAILLVENNPAGAFALGFALGIPALIGIFIYRNHRICFDKDNIVYRNNLGKISRFVFEDINEIIETDKTTYLVIGETKIPVNRHNTNSKWILELAQKKAAKITNKKKFGDDLYETKPSGLMGAILIIGGIFFLGIELLGLAGDSIGKYFVLYPLIFMCFFFLIPFFKEKTYYNEEKIIFVSGFTGRKKEYYFADLVRVESNYNMLILHFTNGKLRISTGISEASAAHLSSVLDSVFEEKIEAIRSGQGDKAAEEAELNLFARNHGKSIIKRIYGPNILSDNSIWLVYVAIILCTIIALIPENNFIPDTTDFIFASCVVGIISLIYILFIIVCRKLHRLPNGLLDLMLLIIEPSLECYERMSPEKQERYRYKFYEISEEEEAERRERALAGGMTEEEYEKEDLHILDRIVQFFGKTIFRGNVLTYYPFLKLLGCTLVVSVMAFCALVMGSPLDESDAYKAETTIVHVDETFSPLDAGRPIIFIDENDTEYEALRLKAYCSDYDKLIKEANNGATLHFYGAKRDYGMLVYSISDEHGNVYYTKEDAEKAYAKWERSEFFGNTFILVTPFLWLGVLIYALWLRYPNRAPKSFIKHVIKSCYITETFVERIPEELKEIAQTELKKQEETEKNPPKEDS